MPINAFGGGPGTGKTYSVLEHVILPALAKGRFVITNIEGLQEAEIYAHVADKFYKGEIFCIGHIRCCDRDAPHLEDFFPGQDQLDKPGPVPAPDNGKVCGGDLVVIDEATRYWGSDAKVKKGHAYFFREHRHFANELGHTCDLVVIDPDLSMLVRALKGKVEMASVTHKPKEIGLNRYVVNLYRGVRTSGKPTSTQGPFKFKPEIYTLYKSYSHAAAKEQSIDKRQNLLNNPRLWMYAAGLVSLFCLCMWGLYAYYRHQVDKFSPKDDEAAARAVTAPGVSGSAVPTGAAGAAPGPLSSGGKSGSLRVAGEVVLRGERWIVVVDDSGATRLENPAAFVGRGILIVGNVEGQRVTTWTGTPAKKSIVGGSN